MNKIEITPELLVELKDKAEKATPEFVREGDSIYGPKHPCSRHYNGRIFIARIAEGSNRRDPNLDGGAWMAGSGTADAAYIAAANPSVVLGLLDHIEGLEAENARLKIELHDLNSSGGEMTKDYRQLEREADWLAGQLSRLGNRLFVKDGEVISTCPDSVPYKAIIECISEYGGCQNCWREAARKAVEAQCSS